MRGWNAHKHLDRSHPNPTVCSLLLLNPQQTAPALFPDPLEISEGLVASQWEQKGRQGLLGQIDQWGRICRHSEWTSSSLFCRRRETCAHLCSVSPAW